MKFLLIETRWGQIIIQLLDQQAPVTCAHFINWIQVQKDRGFSVFRIVSETSHQADDPCPIHVLQMGERGLAADRCASASRYPASLENTLITGLTHRKWTVSAARIRLNELIGSFFVCMRDEPELDHGGNRNPDGQGFAAFGRVTAGFDVLEKLYGMANRDEWLDEEIPLDAITFHET